MEELKAKVEGGEQVKGVGVHVKNSIDLCKKAAVLTRCKKIPDGEKAAKA